MIDKIFRLVKLLYRATPSWLRILVGITISGVLAWLAFREQNLEEVITAFKGYPVWSALLGLLLFFISLWFRAIRWRVLLIDEKTSTFQLFLTQNAGTGINNVLPIRILSEPIQLALVTKRYGMKASTALATLVTEHVLDVFATASLMGLGVLLLPEIRGFSLQMVGSLVLFTVSLAVLFLVARGGIPGLPFIGRLPYIQQWTEAMASLRSEPKRLLLSFVSTIIHWLCLGASGWVLADALGMDLHFLAVVVMIVAATFFVNSIPSAPGALGTFEYAIHITLGFFGFTGGAVVPFSLSMHVILFVPPACIAMFVVPQLGLGLFDLRRGLSKSDLSDKDDLNNQKND